MNHRMMLTAVVSLLALLPAIRTRADDAAEQAAILRQQGAIKQKMAAIRIPQIAFRQANINDVIEFLQTASVDNDPKRRGVNMIFSPRQPRNANADGSPAAAVPTEPPPMITFSAKDMSLLEALDTITSAANLEYHIEGSVVMIRPAAKPPAQAEDIDGKTRAEIAPRTIVVPRLKGPSSR